MTNKMTDRKDLQSYRIDDPYNTDKFYGDVNMPLINHKIHEDIGSIIPIDTDDCENPDALEPFA